MTKLQNFTALPLESKPFMGQLFTGLLIGGCTDKPNLLEMVLIK